MTSSIESSLALWVIECVLRSALEGRSALGAHTAHEGTAQDNGQLLLTEAALTGSRSATRALIWKWLRRVQSDTLRRNTTTNLEYNECQIKAQESFYFSIRCILNSL
jgi:hypothetical protein